ncbi:MAG TPA: hypothetical protein VMW27_00510 [Thermoanaerobaculia bacterium]|nr:hypothetical protein [Thermoanaerobaculia bacterium]
MNYDVHMISSPVCDAWIAGVNDPDVEYCYGGTRMVPSWASNNDAEEDLVRLMFEESHLKNRMINRALEADLLEDLAHELPKGYLRSRVGGGRCIMRPRNEELDRILRNPAHPDFGPLIAEVFREIGELLNRKGGRIKLTPDFGRFAGLADELATFTPHVLGVRCNAGGCGGKASYTVTGIVSALEVLGLVEDTASRITLVGSAGALGVGVLEYFQQHWFKDIAICDLSYDDGSTDLPDGALLKLASQHGRFTNECLQRGGTLIFTTWGEELENSDIDAIPPGSQMILAHNLSIPPGDTGRVLMRQIANRGIFALPGQVLTLGGALTSRLEWFWRQNYPNADFTGKKKLAHLIADRVVAFLVEQIEEVARVRNLTPFEAMWAYAEEG